MIEKENDENFDENDENFVYLYDVTFVCICMVFGTMPL